MISYNVIWKVIYISNGNRYIGLLLIKTVISIFIINLYFSQSSWGVYQAKDRPTDRTSRSVDY